MLRPELLEALGLGEASPWNRRFDLIRGLPGDLTAVETDALLVAMMEECPRDLYPAVHSSYMHEIACILQQHGEIRDRFTQVLATLARDTGRDQGTRDYAVQHLCQVWNRATDDPALRTAVVEIFREFAALDSVVSIPALLALHLLGSQSGYLTSDARHPGGSETDSSTSRSRNSPASFYTPDSDLIPLVQPVIAGTTFSDNIPLRLTAVRIAGERRMAVFRKPLLATLKDNAEHALVRMATANALGKIADPADLKTLATLDPGDTRVAAAIRHAVQSQGIR
jgi:hypothetical protein